MHIEQFTFNSFQTNCFIVWDNDGNCAFIDPGCATSSEIERLTSFVDSKGLKPQCILLTHCHFDHIYGMAALAKEYDIPVHADMEEMYTLQVTNQHICNIYGLPLPEEYPIDFVKEGDVIKVGSLRFEVISTPGHSKGGLCFLERAENVMFSGDTLFAGAIGRTDHPGGDYDQMIKNIFEKIVSLDGAIVVHPGHGPSTDIATERMTNPFLQPFNEPYEE